MPLVRSVVNEAVQDPVQKVSGELAPVGLLSEKFGGGASAAYSLRDIGADGGPVVTVRKDGTASEQDFSAVELTNGTLAAFCGSSNGLVSRWIDQTGNGNHALQDEDGYQPKIVNSGTFLNEIVFDGSNDYMQTTTQVLTSDATGSIGMYAVVKQTSGDDGYICGSSATDVGGNKMGQSLYGAGSSQNKVVLNNGNDASGGTNDNITIIEGSFYLISSCYSDDNEDTLQTNGGTTGYANGGTDYTFNAGPLFTIGARKDSTTASTVLFTGSMKEIIAYSIDTRSSRTKIQNDMLNHYGL